MGMARAMWRLLTPKSFGNVEHCSERSRVVFAMVKELWWMTVDAFYLSVIKFEKVFVSKVSK